MPPKPPEASDEELIRRTIQGDTNSYGELYDRYVDQIYRYIYYRVTDRAESEDLTEVVFLKTWEKILQNQAKITDFRAWLYRTAHNLVVDHYRLQKMNLSLEDIGDLDDAKPLPERIVQQRQDANRLIRALAQLEPNLQEVVICRFINGLSHAETAQVMGVEEGHTRVMQYRALKKLRQLLVKDIDQHG